MIEKLTQEQINRFPEFVDKWTKIGLSTEPANRKEAEEGVIEAYKIAGLKAPKIVWCSSPISQGLTRAIIIALKDSVGDSVRASVWDSVKASVWYSVGDSVKASVRDFVGDSVGDFVWDSVRASVWSPVMDSVLDSVRSPVNDSVRSSVGDSIRASGYGQHDSNWLAFYDYFRLVCNLSKETEKLTGLWKISKNSGWWLPHENICWISERHSVLKRNKEGRLHCDGGMAIMYPDGWGFWALNGIRVPEYLAVTDAGKLEIDFFLKEENADVKAEFIKKYGIDRMASHGKVVDSYKNYNEDWWIKSQYKLIDMSKILSESGYQTNYAPYLFMKNQTVEGTYHMEGIDPNCKNLKEALNFRFNKRNAKLVEVA